MQIWIVNHYAIPLTEGGPSRHINLAKALQSHGHQVTIIAGNFNHYGFKYIDGVARDKVSYQEHDGVPFVWIPLDEYLGNSLSRVKNLLQFSFRVLNKKNYKNLQAPDIILGSSPDLFSAYSAYRLAKRYRVPFILEMRDVWPDSIVDLGGMSNINPFIISLRVIAKRLYKVAARIITVMPNVRDHLDKKGVNVGKLQWLPNFVNFDRVPIASNEQNNFCHVVYAGSHGLANDLATIVDAAKILQEQHQNIKITMIGAGAQRSALMQQAKDNKLTNIEFLGQVPKAQVFDYLNQADVFLMIIADAPVFEFGISLNKLFDYLALQRPIISNTSAKFHPDFHEEIFYTVQPKNPQALADAMVHFANMSPLARQEYAQKGLDYCREYHSLQQCGIILEKLLSDCINGAVADAS